MSIRVCIVEESDGTRAVVSVDKETELTHLSEQVLGKVDLSRDDKKCYTSQGNMYCYIVEDEICFFFLYSDGS